MRKILILAVLGTVVLMGVPSWAQEAPAPASQDQNAGENSQQSQSEYGGPSILSRGGAPSVFRSSEMVRITPFLAVTGLYNSDMATTVDSQGKKITQDSYGVSGMFGVTGSHTWRHTVLDVDLRGDYRNYSNYSGYDGLDTSLNVSVEHQLSSRLAITLTEDMARARNAYSLPLGGLFDSGIPGYNPAYNALSSNNLLHTPLLASISGGRLSYQWTQRWSFSAGGNVVVTRQDAHDTLGTNGAMASGDAAYRISRYQTLSFNYGFNRFSYLGQMGVTYIHSAGVSYSIRIGRYWELRTSGGASRVEANRVVAVPLDPVLAALIGQSMIFEKSHNILYMPYGGVHLARSFRHSSWGAAYDRSVTSGNGFYGTSGYETANSGYTYSGVRRVSLQIGAGYSRFSPMAQSLGRFRTYDVSSGVTFSLSKGLSLTARGDGRHYMIAGSSYDRTMYSAAFGFSWHPGEYPLAMW